MTVPAKELKSLVPQAVIAAWRDCQYSSERIEQLHRPWLDNAPMHWVYHRRDGWRIHGSTLP